MKRLLAALSVSALLLSVPSYASAFEAPAAPSARKPMPTLAMCAGAFLTGGGADANNITIERRPDFVVVDCPEGADDDPRSASGDTYIYDITWKRWNRNRAVGTGTLNVPVWTCGVTDDDGTPASTVQTMCETGGDVTNYQKMETYPVNFTLAKPRWYTSGKGKKKKRVRTFTQVVATFPSGGPDGVTSKTYKPPRRASE